MCAIRGALVGARKRAEDPWEWLDTSQQVGIFGQRVEKSPSAVRRAVWAVFMPSSAPQSRANRLFQQAELFQEIHEVLHRPRIRRRRRLSDDDLATILVLLEDRAIEAFPTGELHFCRDSADDFLLKTAILGKARFAVSRDDDLKRDLDLIDRLREHGVEVLSVAQFLNLLGPMLHPPA